MTKKPTHATNPDSPSPSSPSLNSEPLALIKAIVKQIKAWNKKDISDLALMLAELRDVCNRLSLGPEQFISPSMIPSYPTPIAAPSTLWALDRGGNMLIEGGDFRFRIVEAGSELSTLASYDDYFHEKRTKQILFRVGSLTNKALDKRAKKKRFSRVDYLIDLIAKDLCKEP